MSGEIIITLAVIACLTFIIVRQQQTIDRLTNKITGYVPPQKVVEIKEDDVSPKESEPLSWHDH